MQLFMNKIHRIKGISYFSTFIAFLLAASAYAVQTEHFNCTGHTIAKVRPTRPYWGLATWKTNVSWTWATPISTGPDSSGNYCYTKGSQANGDAKVTNDKIILPRWPSYANRCQAEKDEWDRFYDIVKVHEEGHHQVNTNWMNGGGNSVPGVVNRSAIITLITSISVTGVGNSESAAEDDADDKFDAEVETIRQSMVDSIEADHDQYHQDVGDTADPDRSVSCS